MPREHKTFPTAAARQRTVLTRVLFAVVATGAAANSTLSSTGPSTPGDRRATHIWSKVEDAEARTAQARRQDAAWMSAAAFQPPAAPFHIGDDPETIARATDCLTAAIYYEAALEGEQGQRAVAQVVLNRVRNPNFPNTVCGVVFEGSERSTGCQFTFTCDGSLARPPVARLWRQARRIALAALSGEVEPAVGLATHYHADYVDPYWSGSLTKITAIGAHIFYRRTGSDGEAAFYARRLGREPLIGPYVPPGPSEPAPALALQVSSPPQDSAVVEPPRVHTAVQAALSADVATAAAPAVQAPPPASTSAFERPGARRIALANRDF